MFIDINKIDDDGVEFDERFDLAPLQDADGQVMPVRDVRLVARIDRVERRFELRGTVRASIRRMCGRCLEPFDRPVDVRFQLRLVQSDPDAGPDVSEGDEEDATLFPAPEGRVDLGLMATEQIYLDLPMKALCGSGCRGLCPTCGVNRNAQDCTCAEETVDPRWAALAELKGRPEKP